MARRYDTLDHRPGSLPDITKDGGSITFDMRPLGMRDHERLIIRCDEAGEVWISIQPDGRAAER